MLRQGEAAGESAPLGARAGRCAVDNVQFEPREYEEGYHILPYFLAEWDKYKHLPPGALAHCTHVRGSGVMENGIEKPNVRLTLASKIPPEDCVVLNLGYRDTETINPADWQNREDEGILCVAKAGEMVYKVRGRR